MNKVYINTNCKKSLSFETCIGFSKKNLKMQFSRNFKSLTPDISVGQAGKNFKLGQMLVPTK